MSKLSPISHFLSPVSCDLLVLQGLRCECRCVKFGVIALTLSYWSLEVQHGTSWQRTLWGSEKRIVALHKEGIGYKKIAKTLKLSCIKLGCMAVIPEGDLNPIEHMWFILKRMVEEHKVSNIHQLSDVVIKEWKRTPVATCEALVNSMHKRVKAVYENNSGHTK